MKPIVLIIDDNPQLVEGVKLTLEMEGYQVLAAMSGAEAMDVLERITPDLILADIMMPGMDGYELYDRVHADPRWVQVPFIFLTAKTDKVDIRRGKEMGADDYITKPFDPQDIVAAVRGRLKRMAEVTGRPARGDVKGYLKYLWASKVGPIPVPVVALLAVVLLAGASALAAYLLLPREAAATTSTPLATLRPGVGEMITIPAGEFLMGGSDAGASPQRFSLPQFQIDRYEVTNAQYQEFARATGREVRSVSEAMAELPVTYVTWEDARAYCEWAGKRLPTSAEWEKAARGTDGYIYPWGNEWQDGMANTSEAGLGGVRPVGSFPEGASPYGVEDMAGNVWEWVADEGTSAGSRVIRGGAWNAVNRWARTFAKNEVQATYRQDNLGFRCAR